MLKKIKIIENLIQVAKKIKIKHNFCLKLTTNRHKNL